MREWNSPMVAAATLAREVVGWVRPVSMVLRKPESGRLCQPRLESKTRGAMADNQIRPTPIAKISGRPMKDVPCCPVQRAVDAAQRTTAGHSRTANVATRRIQRFRGVAAPLQMAIFKVTS